MKKYKIGFTETFKEMFRYEFNKYYAYSPTYALKMETLLYRAISILELFPYASPSVKFKYLAGNYRKFIIKNRFFIVFQITNNDINLLYFIDGRQSLKNYFNNKKTFFLN